MRLDNEVKLDYKDVLLKPKRSTLSSRRDVEMTRSFTFKNSKETYECCPIIASNMDGVGTFSMAKVIQEYKMMTTITKTTTIEQWRKAVGEGIKLKYVSVCTGTGKLWDDNAEDYTTMQEVLKSFPDVKFITVDVANGYHTNFSDFIRTVREHYPDKTIIAGNVVTAEMTEELILNGADIVKSGSADLTIDSGGRIDLSADDNGEIRLWDGSSKYAQFKDDDDRLKIQSMIQDKDIMFVGNDGGSEVTAMKLDMSEGGLAICYGGVAIGGTGTANTLSDYEEGTWTVAITMGSGTAAVNSSNNTLSYTKVGRLVTIGGQFRVGSVSSPDGEFKINLPLLFEKEVFFFKFSST